METSNLFTMLQSELTAGNKNIYLLLENTANTFINSGLYSQSQLEQALIKTLQRLTDILYNPVSELEQAIDNANSLYSKYSNLWNDTAKGQFNFINHIVNTVYRGL